MKQQNIAVKYVALGSAVVLLLGLTVWLIRSEGRRTREAIHDAAKEAGSEVRKGIVEGTERAVDKAAQVAGEGDSKAKEMVGEAGRVSREVLGDARDILRPAEKPDARTPPPATPEKPSTPPAVGKEEKSPAAGRSGEAKTPSQPPAPRTVRSDPPADPKRLPRKKPSPASDPIERLFELGHEVSKAADEAGQEVLALSWQEEQKVGREVHRMLARDCKLLRPPAVIERLRRLAKPIIDQRTRRELTFTLEVIKSDEINAFAHSGGYVYVTTGMLDFAKPDTELQFFLAHETAHQELRHVVKRMTYAARASELVGEAAGTPAQMAYLTIAVGYSEEQELEADAWAFRAMLRAGRSRDESLSAMRHLLAYINKRDLEPKRSEARNPADRTLRQIEDHFMAHPPTAERLRQLEAIEAPAQSAAESAGQPGTSAPTDKPR